MAKKTKDSNLSIEERLEQALIPNWDEPYKLPPNWCWVKLSSISMFERGITFPASAKESLRTTTNIPCLRTANVQESLELDDLLYVDRSYVKDNPNKLVRENDIIMSTANSRELVGKTSFVHSLTKEMTFGGFIMAIRSKIDPKYLFYFLRLQFLNGKFMSNSTQTTNIANINSATLGETETPIPPLEEQKRIVVHIESLFAKLDEAKEKAQGVVDGFEARKAAILHRAFSGELTAKWREENKVSIADWEHHNFSDLCKIVRGGSPRPAGSPEFYGGDIPFMKVADITRITTPYVESTEHFIKPAGLKKTRMVKANTLLLTNSGATLGVPAICTFDTTFNDGIAAFLDLPSESLLFYYYFWTMKTPKLRAINKGAAQPNLNTDIIGAVELDVPSLEEQKVITNILEHLITKEQPVKEAAEAVVEQIEMMKKAILARAFCGELGTNNPSEESALELLKSVLLGNTNQQEPQKSNKKSTSIPNHIETALLTKLEKKIVSLFYTTENKTVSIDEIMSVSSKKIDIIDTLTRLEQREILIRLDNSCYRIKE